MRRSVRLMQVLVLLCAAILMVGASSIAHPNGHLYFSRNNHGGVVRFPLYNGLPSKPDLFIGPPYGGFVAVAGNGVLYALGATQGQYFTQIGAFGFGKTKPSRVIEISSMPGCQGSAIPDPIYGIAADRIGNLYVLIDTYFSGLRPPHVPSGSQDVHMVSNWELCSGVAIFGPHQHGLQSPNWKFTWYTENFGGIAADSATNVYVDDNYDSQVLEFSRVFSDPTITRTLSTAYGSSGVACDSDGNVYVLSSGSVYVYSRGNATIPRNVFQLAGGNFYYIAATTQYVYVQDVNTNAIEIYDANASGNPTPVATLKTHESGALAVGP